MPDRKTTDRRAHSARPTCQSVAAQWWRHLSRTPPGPARTTVVRALE